MESRLDIFKKFEAKPPAIRKRIYNRIKGTIKSAGYRQINDDLINNEIVNLYKTWQHES
jgi:hypothetical protein